MNIRIELTLKPDEDVLKRPPDRERRSAIIMFAKRYLPDEVLVDVSFDIA